MPTKLYKILLILGIVAVMVTIPAFWFVYSASNNLEVDFLDVGQGDSILIKTPFGQNVLIDGGPDSSVIKELSENMDWWDKQIDLMILTHPHDDHVAGLNEVLKRYNVKKILYTGVIHDSPSFITWLELIKEQKIPLVIIDRPQTIYLSDFCKLDIFYPFESLLGKVVDNLNNSSIASKLDCQEKTFLFAGDAEKEIEDELLEKNIDLSAQVMKASHHGSDTSNSEEFIEAVNPEIVVIQVGEDNSFGHPSRRAIKRFERIGAQIFRNDLNGTIKIINEGGELSLDYEGL